MFEDALPHSCAAWASLGVQDCEAVRYNLRLIRLAAAASRNGAPGSRSCIHVVRSLVTYMEQVVPRVLAVLRWVGCHSGGPDVLSQTYTTALGVCGMWKMSCSCLGKLWRKGLGME